METPALFVMAPTSLQPQSVDTAIYVRVNPLPSTATSSPYSGDLNLYIESNRSSPSVSVGPPSSSQQLSLQGDQPLRQPSHLFHPTTQPPSSLPPPQTTHSSSWADEVAAAEQSGHSAPETVFPNWAYSGRISGTRPWSQLLVHLPPVMPPPLNQSLCIPSHTYESTIPPRQPEPDFPQPPPYDRPTSTDNLPFTNPSPKRRSRVPVHENYPVR